NAAQAQTPSHEKKTSTKSTGPNGEDVQENKKHVLGVSKVNPPLNEKGMFYNSKWDPLLEQPPFNRNYQTVLDIAGHYEEHIIDQSPEDAYGDLSLFTLNLSSTISTEEMNQQSTLVLKQVLDHIHPSVMTLQGIREPLMARLKKIINEHYQILDYDSFTKDSLSAANYYNPIIIDKKIFSVKNSGYMKNSKGVIYASWVELSDHRNNQIITVINMDLFSTFRGVVESQFANIIADIKGSKEQSSNPVFFMGGLGSISKQIENLLHSGYKNVIDVDSHNLDLDKTTVHGKVEHSDDIERDFIILRDPSSIFTINYGRILSKNFPVADHYPVHAILSYTR
ncbi:putative Endonuclease/exonuclease/phosphatase protein, partial [Pseudoloma neurophilia]